MHDTSPTLDDAQTDISYEMTPWIVFSSGCFCLKNFIRRSSRSGRDTANRSVPVNAYTPRSAHSARLVSASVWKRVIRTLPAAEKVPIAVPIAAQAPKARGSDLALTPAMKPAAQPPAAAFIASSV